MITSANKMREGTRMTVSYSADISETISFDPTPDINRRNHERFSRFIASLGLTERLRTGQSHLARCVWRGRRGSAYRYQSFTAGSRKARGDYLAKVHPVPEPSVEDSLSIGPLYLVSNLDVAITP